MRYIIVLLVFIFSYGEVSGEYHYIHLSFYGTAEVSNTKITLQNGFTAEFNRKGHALEIPFNPDSNNNIIFTFTTKDGSVHQESISSQEIKSTLTSAKDKVLYTEPLVIGEFEKVFGVNYNYNVKTSFYYKTYYCEEETLSFEGPNQTYSIAPQSIQIRQLNGEWRNIGSENEGSLSYNELETFRKSPYCNAESIFSWHCEIRIIYAGYYINIGTIPPYYPQAKLDRISITSTDDGSNAKLNVPPFDTETFKLEINGDNQAYQCSSSESSTIELPSKITKILFDYDEYKLPTKYSCPVISYAVVFTALHDYVDDEKKYDFWSQKQAEESGREGAIILTTNSTPYSSDGTIEPFKMPNVIIEEGTQKDIISIIDYDSTGIPSHDTTDVKSYSIDNNGSLKHSLPKEFCKGSGVEHTITIKPEGCIPQKITYTLKGYYHNISIEENDYSYFACNQDDNDGGGLLTIKEINKIDGGTGGGYILVETDAENNETKTDIKANEPIRITGIGDVRIRDNVEDDGWIDRQSNPLVLKQTSNIPKINLEPTPVTCHDESTGSVTVSIDIDNISDQWGIDPGKDINPQITEDNKIFFSDLSAGEYTVSCTIQENCYIVDTTVTIAQPDIPIEFKLKSTPTTCEGSGDGLITVSSISIQKNEEEEEKDKFTTLIYYATEEQSKNLNTLQYNLFYKENQQSESHQFNDNDEPTPFENKSYYVYTTVKANETNECSSSEKIVKIDSENPQKTLILLPTAVSCEAAKNGILSYDTIGRFKPTMIDNLYPTEDNINNTPNISGKSIDELINYKFGFGTYQIVLSDGKGCIFDSSFKINTNSYTFSSSTENASCADAPNGSAEISATISTTEGNKQGEFNPTCYTWTLQDNQSNKNITEQTTTTNTINGLLSGTYNVKINHDGKCTSSTEVVIGTNTYNFQGTQYHDLSCVDASNGDITAQINKSGNGDFNINSYTWHVKPHVDFDDESNCQKISDDCYRFSLQGLSKNEYTLKVFHDEKCENDTTIKIDINDYSWSTEYRYLSCPEASNGYISASIQRADNYTGTFNINNFTWTLNGKKFKNGENPTKNVNDTYPPFTLSDLGSGLYQLSLTHDDKCTESTTVNINVNEYSHFVNTTNAPCVEINSGSAIAVSKILSGTPESFNPHYFWTVKNGEPISTGSNNFITERYSGDYNVRLEWEGGCNTEINFEIKHDTLRPSFLTTHAECADKQSIGGRVEINMSPERTYKYIWDDDTEGTESNIAENLAAGTHSVRIVDQHNCSIKESFDILNSDFSVNVKSENALCRQDATGKVIFDIKGGRGKYAIDWQGNSALSQKDITANTFTQDNVPVGVYTINVKDETNCVSTHKVTIASGNLKVSHKETEASCSSIGNARAEIAVSGAKLPVTYKWSDNVETPDPVRNNLTNGNYVVTVVDQNNCSMPVDIKIYSKKLSTSTAIDSATCGLDPDGAADIRLFSATSPFTFTWPDGKITSDSKRSGLDKGNYDVLITDANGCEVHANVAIPHKGYLQNDVPSSINLCYNGEITVDANEFDGYEWICNGWMVDNNRFLTVKSPGTYIIKANGYDDCYAVDTISVTMSPTFFSPYFRMSSASYINDTLVVMEMSQTNPDKYSWKYDTLAFDCDNSKGSERELRLIPKLSGIYSVTLSAENQDCVSDISKPVEIFATVRPDDELSPLYVERSIVKDFAISPNPTKGPITVEVNLSQISDVRLTIYDLNFGKIRKQVTLRNSDNYKLDINDILSSGAYVVILQTGNETKQIKYIVSR